MLYIKLKEMEHKITCLPVCGLWSAHDDLSNQFEPRSKLRDFFFIFSSYL